MLTVPAILLREEDRAFTMGRGSGRRGEVPHHIQLAAVFISLPQKHPNIQLLVDGLAACAAYNRTKRSFSHLLLVTISQNSLFQVNLALCTDGRPSRPRNTGEQYHLPFDSTELLRTTAPWEEVH